MSMNMFSTMTSTPPHPENDDRAHFASMRPRQKHSKNLVRLNIHYFSSRVIVGLFSYVTEFQFRRKKLVFVLVGLRFKDPSRVPWLRH